LQRVFNPPHASVTILALACRSSADTFPGRSRLPGCQANLPLTARLKVIRPGCGGKGIDGMQEDVRSSQAMDVTADLSFPFVDELPKREKSRWQKFRDVWAEAKAKGPLIPASLAAKLCDVTRQRIDELMARGKLERVELQGHVMITEASLIAWLEAPDDKGGRPRKLPSNAKELWKVSHEWAKESRQPQKK
jgi:hypothetical protein